MRLKVIASSSKGNCYIIGNKEEILILECGVTFASIKKGVDMKIRVRFIHLLIMLFYLAWWKICDIEEFIKRILKIERSKE